MDSKEICFRILRVESEHEVAEIISSVPEMLCPDNWYPVDKRDTNFNIVTNQASTGGKALTELCTNMVDAVLLKHAHEKNIDPTGPDVPQSVIDGVRDLVRLEGARSGILSEVDDPKYLQEFAERNLVIGITGGTRKEDSICFTFVDNGEGQHPDNFEDTFLSLSKGNKSNIPFVQGKYNMGSSGVLSYCGKHWYKLIISRRYDNSGNWGWTLIRRRPRGGIPVAEYFKPAAGICSFSQSVVYPILLQNSIEDKKVHIATGTIVKLYDYQMESATNFRYIREALEQNLISTILPFRLMDYRVKPQRTGRRAQGVDERRLYGMEFLLLNRYGEDTSQFDDDEPDHEPGSEQHIGEVNHPELGCVSVRAIVLKKDLPGWLKPHRNISRVFHAVNGQVQFKENRAYLSQRCNLPGLKDRIVIIVDASRLSEAAHNDVWKGDRENIRATSVGKTYKNEVTSLILNSQFLKDLQHRFAQEEMRNMTDQSKVEIFQDLINNDPNIARLLLGGSEVKLPGHVGRGEEESEPEPWQGKYSPTFLKLVGRSIRKHGAEIAVHGRRRITFETDVVNDYMTRPDNRGRVFDIGDFQGKYSYTSTLRDGILTVVFQALDGQMQPREKITLSIALQDDAIPEPVAEELTLIAVQTRTPTKPGDKKRNSKPDIEIEMGAGRSLPQSIWLTKDGRMIGGESTNPWPEDFTDQDGGNVHDLGETRMYHINYDNAHFRQFLDRERNEIDKKVITAQYRIGMLVLMMGMEDAYNRMIEGKVKDNISDHILMKFGDWPHKALLLS